MSWLDPYLSAAKLFFNSSPTVKRGIINLTGAGVTVTDNPISRSTDIAISGGTVDFPSVASALAAANAPVSLNGQTLTVGPGSGAQACQYQQAAALVSAASALRVKAASTGPITLPFLGAPDPLDGQTVAGDYVSLWLLKDQATASENGIYQLKSYGTPHPTDHFDRADALPSSAHAATVTVDVLAGTANHGTRYRCVSAYGSDVVGTNNLTWYVSPTIIGNTSGTITEGNDGRVVGAIHDPTGGNIGDFVTVQHVGPSPARAFALRTLQEDGAADVPSLRTLGTGAGQAMPGNTVFGYMTGLDLDLSAEPNQVFLTDTAYTVGGKTWNAVNVAHSQITGTSSGFIVPAVGSTTTVTVSDATGFSSSLASYVNIATAGQYQVTAVSGTTITIKNLGWDGNAAPGTVIASSKVFGAYPCIVNGVGLVIQPNGDGNDFWPAGNFNAPRLSVALSQVTTPQFGWASMLKAYARVSAWNGFAATQMAGVAVHHATPINLTYKTCFGYSGNKKVYNDMHLAGANKYDVSSTYRISAGDDVVALHLPMISQQTVDHLTGTWSSGWPTGAGMYLHYAAGVGTQDWTAGEAGSAQDMLLSLMATGTNVAGSQAIISNVRADYRP